MKLYFLALFVMGALVSPIQSSATDSINSKREIKSNNFDVVYLGSVTRPDGVIYLYVDEVSNTITYAEFISPGHTYSLSAIVNGKTDYTIVRGHFTFIDENGNSKVVILNNATFVY